ncbi:hypothetical protein M9458_050393 [Cirrhinus mrigala]|uniref:ribonuclease H n=1 Tax=Cirrhinus mrigala TaxID=683832 RepID=A0ABD0MWC0_CIRMR
MSNPDPFQELVDSLRKVLIRSPTTMPSTPPPEAPPAPSTSSATVPSSPTARPAPYSGGAEECNGFLLQCSLIFTMQPALYPTDQSQIAFITSLLTGPALRWAETIWHQAGPPTRSIQAFIAHFKEVFGHADEKVSAGEQLYHLKQGNMTTHEYSLCFRTLAAASGWNERSLLTTYRLGLEPKLRMQLAALDDNMGLEKFIQQSLRCSDRLKTYQSNQETVSTALLRPSEPVNPSEPEPMIIESGKLTSAEPQRRLTRGLCMYCGASGHVRLNCPLRPVRTSVSGIHSEIENMHPLTTNVQLTTPSSSVAVTALIDSGSAGNFISGNLCRQLQLCTEASSKIYQIQPITGDTTSRTCIHRRCEPINLQIGLFHQEDIQFLVQEGATVDIILGRPWLVKHDPIISWGFGEVLKWDAAMPRGKIYPLSLPETKAMEEYIQEALSQGYIRPFTSPAASSFFFVVKKDRGLRPCIDYRALNQSTIKFRYPLPLVPAALEQLRSARIFTKLDLRSAYNLVRIREGDEWKPAFVTPTGHYEYLVMHYLVNAPSVFQNFIHEVLQEFLHHFVIVYIDDILIYSRSETEHRHHVAEVLQKLREHQLYPKAEKCSFHLPSVKFLGYCIDHQGVRMDERKVSAVVSWPEPTTIKELQRFLGFANFYRRFIQNYSLITTPLTNLLSGKPRTLLWTPEAAEAFHSLKSAFTQAPLLTHPDPDLPFVVEVDASTTGVGAVLSQYHGTPKVLHPCGYFSWKLSPAERNYDIGNRELLAIKLALEEWRHWLEGAIHPFQVITDHKNLQYLRDAKRLCPRQARCTQTSAGLSTRLHAHLPGHWASRGQQYSLAAIRALLVAVHGKGCEKCAISKRKLHPLPVPNRLWSHLGVDFMTDLPSSDGNTCILVIIDRFSKFCRLLPLKGLPTALETADILFNHIFRYYGIPEDIVSDRGELAPRLSLVSPKVFFSICHRWSFGSLPLSPLACLVGDTFS